MPPKLIFETLARNRATVSTNRPLLKITTDIWDDFGHKVQFHLAYIGIDNKVVPIGPLKVLQKNNNANESMSVATNTKLPSSFSELGENFISLGQGESYYKKIAELFGKQAEDVLEALCDIAWQPTLAIDFEPTSAFRNAMMRENGAHRARRFGRTWASGQHALEKLSFDYSGIIDGADAPIDVTIAFEGRDSIPGRIVGIIGRNAVGKTQFLASLGSDLAQISRSSAESLAKREERFPKGRPLFTRIIAISYSAFDKFKRPPPDSSTSYVYCGIRNENGGLSRTSLVKSYRFNQNRIRTLERQSVWTSYMKMILGDLSDNLTRSLEAEIAKSNNDDKALSLLSSGQSILAHFVTALLAWIQPNTLVLFDEPETHLHPNAVASLFLALSDILESFDSYAIVATHSPVVIQEIPAKRVLLFQREGNMTVAEPLMLESFGESVTELTRHVFETIEVENVYKRTLKDLADYETPEEILAMFKHGLSLNAQAYLLAQYDRKKRHNQ